MNREILAVSLVGNNPVIPAKVEGRPVCLDDYDAFSVLDGDRYTLLSAVDFYSRYIPSRLWFQGAGHG